MIQPTRSEGRGEPRTPFRWWGLFGTGFIFLYVVIYAIMTLGGAYAGNVYGLRAGPKGEAIEAPKGYSWAPLGFEVDGEWNIALMITFAPLYWLDTRFWHTDDLSYRGIYPIRRHPVDGP